MNIFHELSDIINILFSIVIFVLFVIILHINGKHYNLIIRTSHFNDTHRFIT
jgi:hypothetical protein